jgi:TolB-like protein/tetratricopeptide (TPR) repeat protein
MIGRTLGHYRIIEKIGAGGMGDVYLARDERLQRDVAIKILPAGTLADETARARFRKEALALSRLNHPNIATVHDFDTSDGVDFLVMEYIRGVTLNERLTQGPLPEKDVIRLGTQLAEGLEAGHKENVIHRDIKPGNIRVTLDGRAKILDFGLAKVVRPAGETATADSLSETGTVGTLPYMAPEQVRGRQVDARTDIWALGTVLYEMATGRRPFLENDAFRLGTAILESAAPSPRALNDRIPFELERIILKTLEKEPARRYGSAAALLSDLRRLDETDSRRTTPGAKTRAWRTGATMALAAGLALAGGGYWLRRAGSSPSALPGKIMIAVLPFENLSDNPKEDYFADGLTEETIAQLGELQPSRLGVIARTSAMRYKHTHETVDQIGRQLNVSYVLEGSIRLADQRVRVTAQLIQVSDQTHLWAESYERPLSHVLRIQSEVAQRVTQSLAVELLPSQRAGLTNTREVDPEAYETYLLGRNELRKQSREGIQKAIEYFQKAIQEDPQDARAQAALSEAYWAGSTYYVAPLDVMPKAKAAALRSLELDDNLADAHASLGNVLLFFDWDWPGSEREFRRALALNPSLPDAHMGYADYLATLGKFDESIAQVRQAYALDPVSPSVRPEALWIYLFSGRSEDFIEQCKKLIDLEPESGIAYALLAQAYAQTGRSSEAADAASRATHLGNAPVVLITAAAALARAARPGEARRLLDAGLAQATERYVCRFNAAAAYAQLGETERAFESLDAAFLQRSD